MDRKRVRSSYLLSIGYDAATMTLEVEFRRGGVYRYSGVPRLTVAGLMSARSHGRYFHAMIRNAYPYRRISP